MKKIFFAKYVPVEGEIQEGMLFKAHHNNNVGIITSIKQGQVEPIIHYGNNWFTNQSLGNMVKLMLCSRDIQVGDTVIDNIGRTWENCEECYIKVMSDGNITGKGASGYKIIGEISPEVKWVKEGDEITEDAFTIVEYDNPNDTVLLFKCPCCGEIK